MPKLPTVSRAWDQNIFSDRCVAAIASAILQDVGIITEDNPLPIIHRRKVLRIWKKTVECAKKDDMNDLEVGILIQFFDGRKECTT